MWVGMSSKLYTRPFETTILIWKMIHSWSLAYSWCQLLREIYHCIRKMKFLKVDRIFSGSLRLPTRESSDGNDFSNWSSKVPQTFFFVYNSISTNMEIKSKQKWSSLPGMVEMEQGQQYQTSKNQGAAGSLNKGVGLKTLSMFAGIFEIWQEGPGKWESLLFAVLVPEQRRKLQQTKSKILQSNKGKSSSGPAL